MAMPINTPTTVGGNTVTFKDIDGDGKADKATIQKTDGTQVVIDGIDNELGLQTLKSSLTSLGLDADDILGGNDAAINQLASGQQRELGNFKSAVSSHINHMLRNPEANTNDSALQSRWSEFMGKAASNDFVDVNALVQYVLRESYLSTTDDLKFYATKVKFFNNMKKEIRDQTTAMREKLAQYAGQADDYILNPPVAATLPDQNFYGTDSSGTQRPSATASGVSNLSGGGLKEVASEDINNDGWTAVATEGGYVIEMDETGEKYKIYDKEGKEMMYIHGDPHVNFSGTTNIEGEENVHHFGKDSTYILPDGTKLTFDTAKGKDGNDDNYYAQGITICSGNDAYQKGRIGSDVYGSGGVEVTEGIRVGERPEIDAAVADSSGGASSVIAFVVEGGDDWDAVTFKSNDQGTLYEIEDTKWENYDGQIETSDDASTAVLTTEQRAALADGAGLQALVGGDKLYTTKAELEAGIKDLETMLSTTGDDAQLANLDLQNVLQKQQQTLQLMSNISKMLNDTAMSIIRKIGG